jgi:hypothetical protein
MQTSAAGNFQPTESLFAVYREPFFNTIDPKRSFGGRSVCSRFQAVNDGRLA